MRSLAFIGLLLGLLQIQVLGQRNKSKAEIVGEKIVGSWKYEKARTKNHPDELYRWTIDTVEFRSDATLTFHSKEISDSQITRYEKLYGTWELTSDLKSLIVTIDDTTVEMPFRFKGKDSIEIKHPIKVKRDSRTTDEDSSVILRFMIVDVTYKRLVNKNYPQQ